MDGVVPRAQVEKMGHKEVQLLYQEIHARGNESARKQTDLPVAKSAQDTGTSQVLDRLMWSAAQGAN